MTKPRLLIIISGLPGTGKTSVAREVSRKLGAMHLRVDSIEQALRASEPAVETVYDHGYRVAYAIAEDNLRLGNIVVADSVNALSITRNAWREVALRVPAGFLDVGLVCSEPGEHRRRVETRMTDIEGLRLPTWDDVVSREYDPWDSQHLVIDTAKVTAAEGASMIAKALDRR